MAHRERAWVSAIAVGLLVYAFAYDNANSWPMALGYAWTRLTPIGREARLVEIPVVLGLVGWAMATGMSRVTRRLLASLLAFIALGLLSYYRDGDVPLLNSMVGSRSAFRECQAIGCTVHGVPGAREAIQEVDMMVDEILSLIE